MPTKMQTMLEAMWDERGQLVQEMQEGTVSSRGYGGILAEGAVMIALSISNFSGTPSRQDWYLACTFAAPLLFA